MNKEEKIGMYTRNEIFEHLCENNDIGMLGRSMYDAVMSKIDSMYKEVKQLQQEKEAMKQLIEWIEECDFGFDNFVNDYEEDINMTEEEFDKETENMSYIESMIHYAKLYIKNKGE